MSAMERRRARRRARAEEHGIVAARVRPGYEVAIVDVSAGGVLIETVLRLLPGATVELHLETRTRHASVRGSIVRCSVVRVRSTGVCYRGAVAFEHSLPWLAEDLGYSLPGSQVTG